jgi:DNA invertase Pin-like site-specific DNA recombinase
MLIGYSRVSTEAQDYASQVEALKAAGCDKVITEKVSGVVTDRRGLAKAIAQCGPGDVLVVTKLDRLAPSLRDLLNVLDAIAKQGAGFKVLDNAALDTTNAYGQLLLGVLGALAQFERELILSRTKEGRARALAAGVKFGRPSVLSTYQIGEARIRRAKGETLASIAQSMNVAHSTIGRAVQGE